MKFESCFLFMLVFHIGANLGGCSCNETGDQNIADLDSDSDTVDSGDSDSDTDSDIDTDIDSDTDSQTDTTPPNLVIDMSFKSAIPNQTVIRAIMLVDEPVVGFDESDVTVTGGTVVDWRQVNPHQYNLRIKSGSGPGFITAEVEAGAFTDEDGNPLEQGAIGKVGIAYAPWAASMGSNAIGISANLEMPTTTMTFVWVEAGEFYMGSNDWEVGKDTDETRHRVSITKGYWIALCESSQRMWLEFMDDNPALFRGDETGTNACTHARAIVGHDNRHMPIENVSWNDVTGTDGFFERFSQYLGVEARLPTEAEWEMAVRADTTTAFVRGPNDMVGDANGERMGRTGHYAGNSGRWKSTWPEPTPLFDITGDFKDFELTGSDYQWSALHYSGLKHYNNFGLRDYGGNVAEMCADWYQEDMGEDFITDPTGPATGNTKVIKGGSWRDGVVDCRSASRSGIDPNSRLDNVGFRIVISGGF